MADAEGTGSPEHFDAIVVGSGFGGSVVTYRLAEAGRRVCLLERGRSYPPGSFPRTPAALRRNFWDPSEGGHGLYFGLPDTKEFIPFNFHDFQRRRLTINATTHALRDPSMSSFKRALDLIVTALHLA